MLADEGLVADGLAEAERGLLAAREVALLTLPPWLAVVAGLRLLGGQAAHAADHLDEAVDTAQRSGETWYLPKLLRLRGELLTQQRQRARMGRALELAQAQRAALLQARAAASLARIRGRRAGTGTARI